MNCTNQNSGTEIPPLKARCNRMGIHVPGENPTPAEIIPIIQQRLATHQKHRSKDANPWTGDFAEWKNIHDAYTEFLAELRVAAEAQKVGPAVPSGPPSAHNASEKPNATCVQPASEKQTTIIIPIAPISPMPPAPQNKISGSEPGKNPQPSPSQQTQARNEPGINPEQPGIARNEAGKFPEELGNSGQQSPTSSNEAPPCSTEPAPNSAHPNAAHEDPDPDAPPKIQSNDEEFVAAATHLHYQRKGRSPFDKLSAQDQAHVIDLFEKFQWQTVLKLIAQPPPLGYGLKVSKTALYDFHKRHEKRQRQQNVQASIDLLNKSSDPTQAFAQIFERLVQTKALTVASDPYTSLNIFDALITSVTKLRKQALAERKQLHAEKPK